MALTKQIFHISKGKKVSIVLEEPNSSSVRYIQIEDLRHNNNLKYTDETKLVHATESDVIIAWDGAYAGTIGFGISGIIGSTLARLRIKSEYEDKCNGRYLGYFLSGKFSYFQNTSTGATIPHVSRAALESLDIPIPDLETQNKIVAILEKANSLVQKRQLTISYLDELLRAQFLEMFGSNNPDFESWKDIEIQDFANEKKGSMRTGPFGSSLKHDEFTEAGEVAVLGIDNAVNNEFRWDKRRFITKVRYEENFKRYTVFPRDVIITIMGTVGRSAVIPNDIPLSINTKHLACITLDETKCNPYYLAYSIHSNPLLAFQMKAYNRGAIMEGLNLGIIKTLKLKNAPISLQNKFEKIYSSIIEKQKLLKQSAAIIKDLLNVLLQRAFSGNLKLSISIELDALLEEIDLQKSENDLFSIITNEEYLLSLVNRLNNQEFENQELYNKAKQVAFQLLKEEKRLVQEYDEQSKNLKLSVR